MKNLSKLTPEQLAAMNFVDSKKQLPRLGALCLCYHDVFGLTVGYYTGKDCAFVFPFMQRDGYNWASHWQYHN